MFLSLGSFRFKIADIDNIYCCSEDSERKENRDKCNHSNKFVSLSESVTGCAAHPLNSMIVAGTQVCSWEWFLCQ
ncbi:hypothetical protein HA466_0167460 [Hirschfeldia incana]|nr:hypothetical protein HA466_0167460 [Hirschfeldia incana]